MEIQRTFGEKLGFSIGTAIPLEETLLVESPPNVDVWFNVRTLFRNFYDSFPEKPKVATPQLVEAFISEIHDLVAVLKQNNIKTLIYLTDTLVKYSYLFKYSEFKTKDNATNNQLQFLSMETQMLGTVIPSIANFTKHFRVRLIGGGYSPIYIVTHNPTDLLSSGNFSSMTLLESHTGKLKTKSEWISKLTKNKKYHNLPFNILSLVVFGDGSLYLKGQRPTIKNDLYQITVDNKWHPMTTRDKIIANIQNSKSDFKDFYLESLRINLP